MEKTNPLSAKKQALLELRLRGVAKQPADARQLSRRADDDATPLSFAQFYIWANDQMVPGNPSHNLPVGFRIRAHLDARLLEDSFNGIARRHEALRTTFAVKDGEPIQVIHPECRIKIAIIELDHLPGEEGEITLRKLASKESVEAFDLSRLPLIRVSLYKLGDTDHVLVVNLHHIIADGLSIGPLLNELDVFYSALKSGSPPNLPDLPVQYADFASWLRREFLRNPYPDQAEYWRAQLHGQLRPLALPFDRVRPTVRSFKGANAFFSIPTSLVEKLYSLDKESGGSFFSIALALFQVVLHRCSGSEDMLILTPISIRTQDELRPLIGDFLNLVPLRCDVSGNPNFIELLRRSRETTLNGLSNKDLPFDGIVDGMKIERDSSRDPIFQSLLQVLPADRAKFAGLELESFQIDYAFSQFDLSLHLYERDEGYSGRFEYSTDVFNADTVERLSQDFMQVLKAVVGDPNRPIATLPLPRTKDRKVLPAPERSSQKAAYTAPRGALERQIAEVWRELLQLKQVDVRENFFDLGGHSLLLVKTCARLCAELNCKLKVTDLFTYPTIEALANHLGDATRTGALAEDALARVSRRSGGSGQAEPIAIVSMAGRFPGAGDIEAFWANLRDGKESITFFSAEEMRESGVPDSVLSDPNYVGAMGYLEDADKFDAPFFGYSARDAELMDPQERILLQCAAEALERAGCDPDRYQGLVGVYAGSIVNSYLSSKRVQHIPLGSAGFLSTALASAGDFLTTRVSYKLNLRGPSVNVQTACSTSLVAVHQACRALRDQECDMALAGGVTVVMPLKSGIVYMEEGIYSPDGHCRTFDADAKGTVGGNGVALVLLKRLSEALADGDPIHAVIRGTAINNDGSSKAGYTAPSVEGQAQVIALAQASAQCDPDTIGYMEAHGTGTLLGDPIEVAALTRVFGEKRRSPACWIGSVKSNVGHLYAVAGVAGLIKAALSLEHKELVPSLNFGNPNPQIDFAAGPFKVSTELRKWESPAGVPRRAGVSSFGFGGTNAHAVLEEAPARESSGPSREWQLLCLSAKTDAALARATANLARHLSEHPDINLADAAYTLQLGRREFSHRCVVVCRDVADALSALGGGIAQRLIRSVQKGGTRSVQFMFTGQGAQYPNMGLGLYRTEALFRETVDYCCERLKSRLGLDLREVLFPAEDVLARAAERIKQTELTQPALFTIEYALAKLWMSLGIQPAAMIGHSIGEYVAACLAGVMSLDDALDLVAERGRLMGQLPPGSMLAIPLSEEQVLPLLSEQLSLAGINSPNLCIVSGPQADIAALEARLVEMELAPRRLHTSHAFHSSMMDPILEPFTRRVSRIPLHPPQLPYISNVTGQWITAEQATDPAYYATHLRQAVQFSKGLEQLFADPNCVFLEIGPGHTLTALAKRHPAHKEEHAFIASLRHADEAQADEAVLMESVGRLWLAGLRADWRALHGNNRRRRVRLPTYPFEQIRYWLEPAKASVGKASVGRQRIGRTANSAEWTYVPSWRRAPTASSASNKREANWLVFADNHGLGSQLETHLIDGGARVVSVAVGERFAMKAPGKYVLNSAAREDYDRLLAELKAASFTPNFIAHLWSVRRNEELRQDEDFSAECKDLGFFSLIFLAQALDACEVDGPLGLAVLTSHVHDVDGSERICPENALVLGPCKVIGMEHPNIRARSIDLAVDGDLRWLGQALANDLCAPWTEPVVAYRGKYRWVQEFEQVQVHYAKATPTLVRDSGVYLIAGGLGLIGLGIAEFLARTARARLVLLSRSGLPERVHWARWLDGHDGDDTVGRTIRRVLAMESSGAKVLVYTVDVADESRMREVIAEAEARFGALCGVVHAAGAEVRLSPIQTLRRADCEVQFRAKLQGLRVLERVLRNKRLDFCLVNSSLASVMGVMEFASYTASHLFMDAFVIQHNRVEGAPWRVVNWDHWVTEGPGAEKQSYYMRPGEATEVLSRFLSMPDSAQVLVSTGDLQGRIDQVILREEPQTDEPEVEASQISQGHPRPALSSQYEAPRNDAERLLADIWAKMLGIAQVGIHDNFFELGGDSVINIQITARANQAGLRFTPKQAFENQTIAALVAIAGTKGAIVADPGIPGRPKAEARDEAVAAHKGRGISESDLAEIRRQLGSAGPGGKMKLDGIDDILALAPLQQGMLFHTLYTPESSVYNLQLEFALEGDLDEGRLEQAWCSLVERHAALRTSFVWERVEKPYQVVHHHAPLKIERHDWRTLSTAQQDERRPSWLEENRTRLFDLTKPPLMRLALIVLSEQKFRLVWTFHHIILEGWSSAIILSEFWKCYGDLCANRPFDLPAVRSYAGFISWLQQQDQSNAEAYWRERLKGFGAPTRLAIDRSIGDAIAKVERVDSCKITLSKNFTDALKSLARTHRVTLNTVVQGAWSILLSRYSGEQDVVYGAVLSGRPPDLPGVESIVGLFVNTLPARVNVDGNVKLISWLQALQLDQATMRQYDYSSLMQVRAWSDVPGGQPLFHTALAFQNYLGDLPSGQITPDLRLTVLESPDVSDQPLMLFVMMGDTLTLNLVYDVERFDRAAVERMLTHCRILMQGMVADPDQRVSDLQMLTEAERHQLLVEWNNTTAEYPAEALFHELFETQVGRAPMRPALRLGKFALSYAELDARATRMAQVLRSRGIGRGQRVGLCVERGADMLAAVLGILKAGAAYVPLDPSFPEERLRFMAEDAQPALLVSTSALAGVFGLPRERLLLLDADAPTLASQSDQPLTPDAALDARPEDPAYVIYTSGSTGKPKGVVVPHRAVVNFLTSMARVPGLAPDDVLVAVATLSFDMSVLELQLPLTLGATVVIASRDEAVDGHALKELLEQHRATVMQATMVTWRLLFEAGWQGGKRFKALVGGEALPKDLADQLIACGVELWNMYGPTETTVWSTCARIADTSNGISIGRPIANTTVYVLDAQKNVCPIGVPGELCIGGEGVTLGYWKRPELTAERFIPDPFSTAPGATLYRTGDLGRWRNDGTLEHLGRSDFQVKIRGFRIELGEIETNIASYPAVRETVVIAREDVPGDQRLVAYVVPRNGDITAAELMQHLSHHLPPYMVPSAFVMLKALPLTPNAKIDRKALPAPDRSGSEAAYIAPRSPTEEALAASWRKALQLQRVGIHDNFFELGGHSLMFARMISEINSMFKSRLGMAELIRNPTVEQFARLIDTQQTVPGKLSSLVQLQEGRAGPPVYFIYAGPGELRLAQHMAGSHPVFGIEARWPLAWRNAVSDNQTSAFPSLEQMVAPYVAELSAHTGSTSCALVGFCYAGQIAFEAAHQLHKLGGKVELVILIDTAVRPPNRVQLGWQTWRQAWKRSNGSSTDGGVQSLRSRIRNTWDTTWWLLGKVKKRLWSYFKRPELDLNLLSGVLDEQGMPVPWALLDRLYEEMAKTYRLRSLDSRGVLFRTGELEGRQLAYAPDDALGWENLFTHGVEIIPVAGHHFSIWGKQIPAIAREINRVLGQRSPDQDDKADIDQRAVRSASRS